MQGRLEELAEGLVEKPGKADTYAVMGRLLNYARQCIATALQARQQEEMLARIEELERRVEAENGQRQGRYNAWRT